jgi:D-threo-aldose 1-dehydrogenase
MTSPARPADAWLRLGVGCAALGQPSVSDAQAAATLDCAWERGIRFYDVAPLYGGGLGEERLGRLLRGKPRASYVLCTKTGVTRPHGQAATPPGSTLPRSADRWDYSRAATRASIGHSLARLGVERLDVVHLHDPDDHLDEAFEAHDELEALRAEGRVGAIGIGSNHVSPVRHLLGSRRFDAFLLAGCYTLLDQDGDALIREAAARGVGVIAGGIYNSGVLAAWPPANATYAYRPAGPEVLARTGRIAATCDRYGVPLGTAALQFVLRHPGIRTVLLGPRTPDELERTLDAANAQVPEALWRALAEERLVPDTVATRQATVPATS